MKIFDHSDDLAFATERHLFAEWFLPADQIHGSLIEEKRARAGGMAGFKIPAGVAASNMFKLSVLL